MEESKQKEIKAELDKILDAVPKEIISMLARKAPDGFLDNAEIYFEVKIRGEKEWKWLDLGNIVQVTSKEMSEEEVMQKASKNWMDNLLDSADPKPKSAEEKWELIKNNIDRVLKKSRDNG